MTRIAFFIVAVVAALALSTAWLGQPAPATAMTSAVVRHVAPSGVDSGACTSVASPCRTINYARTQSNAGDTIRLAPGAYVENINLYIDMTIEGAGSSPTATVVDGGGVERVFAVYGGSIVLRNLTVRNGNGTAQGYGGGIMNNSQLLLDRVIVRNNYSPDNGGGIYNATDLTIKRSLIQNNTSDNVAGGLINFGTVSIDHSTFTGNRALGPTGYAGAIYNNSGHTMTLVNSTVSGNTAASGAGLSNSGSLTLSYVTLAFNRATNNFGSGVSNYGATTFKATIVTGNIGGAECEGDGTFTSQGHNLESSNSCHFNQGSDLRNTTARLRILSNYGGPTPTHYLRSTSPAIDAATNSGCPSNDQRDVHRPINGDGTGGAVCDIGAVEYDPALEFYDMYLPAVIVR